MRAARGHQERVASADVVASERSLSSPSTPYNGCANGPGSAHARTRLRREILARELAPGARGSPGGAAEDPPAGSETHLVGCCARGRPRRRDRASRLDLPLGARTPQLGRIGGRADGAARDARRLLDLLLGLGLRRPAGGPAQRARVRGRREQLPRLARRPDRADRGDGAARLAGRAEDDRGAGRHGGRRAALGLAALQRSFSSPRCRASTRATSSTAPSCCCSRSASSSGPTGMRVGLFGLVLGLAFWQTPQIVPIAVPVIAWTIWRQPARSGSSGSRLPLAAPRRASWIVWNAEHRWASLSVHTSLADYRHSLRLLASPILPMTLGLRAPFCGDPGAPVGRARHVIYAALLGLGVYGACARASAPPRSSTSSPAASRSCTRSTGGPRSSRAGRSTRSS